MFKIIRYKGEYAVVYDQYSDDDYFEVLETGTREECEDLFYDCISAYCVAY